MIITPHLHPTRLFGGTGPVVVNATPLGFEVAICPGRPDRESVFSDSRRTDGNPQFGQSRRRAPPGENGDKARRKPAWPCGCLIFSPRAKKSYFDIMRKQR